MEKRVAIVGAGISGLMACKYTADKGFHPVIFEAEGSIGGVWTTNTIQSTKLQTEKNAFQFSDFPWPSYVKELHPTHTQVREYIESYAQHFNLFPHVLFNSKVISIDYVGVSEEEMQSWNLWGGTGKPFGSRGKWHLKVQDSRKCSIEEYQFEFVILCVGRFGGLPNIPDFPPDQGPQIYSGRIIHSMDYSATDKISSEELIKGKRITIIGSQKSAVDIAAECANANGVDYPCTMIQRSVYWMYPSNYSSFNLEFLVLSRFAELMIHKPGETLLHTFLATLLSPWRWMTSKLIESYLRWELPLKKYAMIPEHSFFQQLSACQVRLLPEKFYENVAEGSIILKKSQSLSFCRKGLIIDGEVEHIQTDLVILATGFKGFEKLKNLFISPTFQKCIKGPPNSPIPLYRQIIQPRIPQLAIIGYAESFSNLYVYEMMCQWVANFLGETFELPGIREMEKEIIKWENYMKRYAGKSCWRSCIAVPIWYNDQLCRDMGCEPRRKKGFFGELFEPYGPLDYAGLSSQ